MIAMRPRSLSLLCPRRPQDLHSFPTRRSSDLLTRSNAKLPESVCPSTLSVVLIPVIRRNGPAGRFRDRKSTRLNSSHLGISYAVFCLKKKIDLEVGP